MQSEQSPRDPDVHTVSTRGFLHLFRDQVARAPNRTALVAEDASVSYGELDRAARVIAGYLVDHGLGRGSAVGICMERTPSAVSTVLGALTAGACCVPLDPSYGVRRLAAMAEDAAVSSIVADPSSMQIAQSLRPATSVDEALSRSGSVLAPGTEPEPSPSTPAFILFTSGSTGRPKGVVLDHGALSHYVAFDVAEYGLRRDDRCLQIYPLSFDGSLEEMLPCLCAGATVCMGGANRIVPSEEFTDYLTHTEVSVARLPSSFFRTWLTLLPSGSFPGSLRLVVIGGEQAPSDLLELWSDHGPPSARLVNVYGPTECTIIATYADLEGRARADRGLERIPIGRPRDGVHVYVLDDRLESVPPGETGEIFIGGAGVARGYVNQPALTAERFIGSPFREGERLFRTGDLGRYREDGQLEFLGRVDRQIKVRGFRVEPEEIEHVLKQHPEVNDAVVLQTDDAVSPRLVAFVVPTESRPDLEAGLRRHLAGGVPNYMFPSSYVFLPELPLTPNGKIDTKQLRSLPIPGAEDEPAGGPTQETIAGIWAQALGHRPRRGDDFFELGGNSLLAALVITRTKAATARPVRTADLFDHSRFADFADRVAALAPGAPGVMTSPPRRHPGIPLERLAGLSEADGRAILDDAFG